jgi:pyruvate dehydrogenase E2 component (dihydrolipoamide acetyltransferase)
VIFEIETDKATLEVEAVDEGRLARIVLPEGGCVAVLEPVAYLADNDADVNAFIAGQGTAGGETPAVAVETAAAQPSTPAVTAPAVSEAGRVKASPAARKIAGERGIDLATVATGSGPGGRIISTDIPATGTAKREEVKVIPVAQGEAVRKKMSGMRKAIARNLLASKQNIPHFYIRATVAADQLFSFYQQEKTKYPCSLNDVVVMGCARTIQEFPGFRSRIDKDKEEIIEFPNSNIGIAVGMDEGLVVPVLVGAEALSLQQIGSETKRLATAARSGKIEGMGKGVFTITNLGMFGVEEFAAIINPPEAAILAVGAAREAVIVSGGAMRPGRVMTMTLSCDHRVVDGMLAAKFMARLKEILENPQQLV